MISHLNSETCLYLPDSSSDKLIIIFSGVHSVNFMGYKLLNNLKVNKLFLRDPTKNWYNGEIIEQSKDANDLKSFIEKITLNFNKKNITAFGSSMGGYAALLFGLKLEVGRILVFGPQVKLNLSLPNNPASFENILYHDLGPLIKQNKTTQIDYFLGMEEITDFYHIQDIYNAKNINIKCVVHSPHNVMGYLYSSGQFESMLYNYFSDNKLPKGILTTDFWKDEKILKKIVIGISFEDTEEKIKQLTSLLKDAPTWSGAWLFLSKLLRKEKKFQQALECAEKAVLFNSRLDIAFHELGMIQFAYKNYEVSIGAFQSAIKFSSKPKLVDYIKLCISYRECKKYSEAYNLLTQAKQAYPYSFSVFFHLGKILELKSNFRAALSYYRKAKTLSSINKVVLEHIDNLEKKIKKLSSQNLYKIFIGGDTILTRYMHFYKEYNGLSWITNDLKKVTNEADISMLNLECVIANRGRLYPKKEYRPFHYRGAPELAEILTDLNVSVAFTANNHAIDFGPEALLEQKDHFNRIGIYTPGSGLDYNQASAPVYSKLGQYTVATISLFTFSELDVYAATKEKAGVFHVTEECEVLNAAYNSFIEAKQYADIIIISPHWTQNWTTNPTQQIISWAHKFIDMGYDAVLGHSSHLIHGVEIYNEHPIVYDMGTLLADYAKGHEEMPYQAAFMLHVRHGKFNALEIIPIELKNGTTEIAKGESARVVRNNLKKRSFAINPDIEFSHDGDRLIVEFDYKKLSNSLKKQELQESRFGTTFNMRMLNEWIKEEPVALSLKANNLGHLIDPINIGMGTRITHINIPESFHRGAGFLLQMQLSLACEYENANYDVHVMGAHEDGSTFYVQYPILQGVYNPIKWKSNQTLFEETIIRPMGNLNDGVYKLYLGFKNKTTNLFLHSSEGMTEINNKLIYIGSIRVLNKFRGKYASGLDWSGVISEVNLK